MCNNHPDDCPDALVIKNEKTGVFYTYLHIVPVDIEVNQKISPGDPVGKVAAGDHPHLHYARHKPKDGLLKSRHDSNSIDPLP